MGRVLLRNCADYDPQRIQAIVGECMDDLGVVAEGLTLIKPNTVIAHDRFFPHAYTRAELLDGLMGAVRERGNAISELWLGERCGITIPTRYAFAEAHYGPVIKKHGARAKYFDEMPQVRRDLFAGGRLRDFIYVPEVVAACDTFISAPKLKSHPWTTITCNLKLNIGLQDDAHRLIDHDHRLDSKIADLFEVVQPKLSVVDAIIAGQEAVMTAKPYPLGLVIVSDDAVATDVVCAHILGFDAADIDHIRFTAERGWGPLDLADIELGGDVSLEQARERARDYVLATDRVSDASATGSNLRYYDGSPPEGYKVCRGGCPGSVEEAIKVIEQLQPDVRREVRRMHLVFGDYRGPIEPEGRERVLFLGDCAQWSGDIDGRSVDIRSCYRDRKTREPTRERSGDLVAKLLSVLWIWLRHLGRRVIRVRGCPVSIPENALYISMLGRTRNPYVDPRLVVGFIWHYTVSRLFRLFGRLRKPMPAALRDR